MTRYLAFVVVLVGCGGPVCETVCGLRSSDLTQCEAMQRAETAALVAFDQQVSDPRFMGPLMCAALQDWTVEVRPTPNWVRWDGKRINGETPCTLRTINIGAGHIEDGILAHELAHAIQRCSARGPSTNGEHHHARWAEDGIYVALGEVYAGWLARSNKSQ